MNTDKYTWTTRSKGRVRISERIVKLDGEYVQKHDFPSAAAAKTWLTKRGEA